MAHTNDKDTIYVDIDDEITAVIDKIQNSSSKVVALVLPKRAATFQSIVNMKLLKRAGEQAKKNLVLVTTESGLMPLAGAVGLHVASTPSSRPEIPHAPSAPSREEDDIDETVGEDEPVSRERDGKKPVGELAGASAATLPLPKKSQPGDVEAVELDNTEAVKPSRAAGAAAIDRRPKAKKDKKLHIPNFDRFRLLLVLGGVLLVLLIVAGYFAFAVLPKATIAIKTNASNINTNVDFILSTDASTLRESSNTVPAKQVSVERTQTGNAQATGQQNKGDRAEGEVVINAGSCSADVPENVPSGSGISSGNKTYITQSTTRFTPVISGGKCVYRSSDETEIVAQSAGSSYNTSGSTTFTVAGRSELTASGSAKGGTDDIQTVVTQADIDTAKGQIENEQNTTQEELRSQLASQGLFAIAATYNQGEPAVTASANPGDEASSVTVTVTTTFTMLGAKQSDIQTIVDTDIKSQIDTGSQSILDRGINQGAFSLKNMTDNGASMNIQTTAEVGPDLNTSEIAEQAAGKKSSEIRSLIGANPDVTEVEVSMSPFWVTKAPSNLDKITVTIAKPTNND